MAKQKHKIETGFQVYCNDRTLIRSSVFDLISGDLETKQTKGLAYILSVYPDFCLEFIKQPIIWTQVIEQIGVCDFTKIRKIIVSAENYTTEKLRADIILKIFSDNNTLMFALIIEAKSINAGNININSLREQVNRYTINGNIKDLFNVPKLGMVLTKYKYDIQGIICLEWNDIINFAANYFKKNNECTIIDDYNDFLINTNRGMIIFDEEVLSLPAGKSMGKIANHSIYECPNDRNYKKPMYITFRHSGGGEMKCLYKISDILVLNAANLKHKLNQEEDILVELNINDDVKKRIKSYIRDTPHFTEEDKRFYILSKTDKIELTEPYPKPKRNNANIAYYSLSEIINNKIEDK